MKAFRIVQATHAASAFDGEGAMRYGGRWNHKGTRIVYLAEYRSLSALEIMVHVDRSRLKIEYNLIELTFPKSVVEDAPSLPTVWRSDPLQTMAIGSQWVNDQSSVLLRVPSVVMEGESNYLLNPTHPEMSQIEILHAEPFSFDVRLTR